MKRNDELDFSGCACAQAMLERVDLGGVRLDKADLRGARLHGSNLRGVSLVHADLSGADLRGCDLRQADLSHAKLCSANLRGANLSLANLDYANFHRANLRDADMRGASIDSTFLCSSNLLGADLRHIRPPGDYHEPKIDGALENGNTQWGTARRDGWGTTLAVGQEAKLAGLDLAGADLANVGLRRADLRRTNLAGASLVGADLRDAQVSAAHLAGADLRAADLSRAQFTRADLKNADLSGAVLDGANLVDAALDDARLDNASMQSLWVSASLRAPSVPADARRVGRGMDLTGMDLSELDLTQVDMSSSILEAASLRGADLCGTDLGGCDLRGADLTGAKLADAKVWGARLCGATFADVVIGRNTGLAGADLRGADLSGALFSEDFNYWGSALANSAFDETTRWPSHRSESYGTRRSFKIPEKAVLIRPGADISKGRLAGLSWVGANLVGARLEGADLKGADLTGAQLRGARLRHADLRTARLAGANLADADLTDVLLGGADMTGAIVDGAKWSGAKIDSATFARSGWTAILLADLHRRGVQIVEWDKMPAGALDGIVETPDGPTLYFSTPLSPFDRFLVDQIIRAVVGQETDVRLTDLRTRDEYTTVRLRGSDPASLEAVADALWSQVWRKQSDAHRTELVRQSGMQIVQLEKALDDLRARLAHIELAQKFAVEAVDADYESALDTVNSMALVMERCPDAFRELGEEDIRHHFLVPLNVKFGGQATGETHNFGGRTDIFVSRGTRTVLIAECKFWDGPAKFIKAVEQLLGYISWRDMRVALLVFNRKQHLTAAVSSARDAVSVRRDFLGFLSYDHEAAFRCVLTHPGDRERHILLTAVFFDLPKRES